MFERALCATEAFALADERELLVAEVDAVREQRVLVERAERSRSRATAPRVDAVLGRVDVQRAELGARARASRPRA